MEISYIKKNSVLTHSELKFYNLLIKILDSKYSVMCQVHLDELVRVDHHQKNWLGSFNRIIGKSVDFVLVEPETLEPVLAIELDDKTHLWPERVIRDSFVSSTLSQVGIPLLRVKSRTEYDPDEVTRLIQYSINKK